MWYRLCRTIPQATKSNNSCHWCNVNEDFSLWTDPSAENYIPCPAYTKYNDIPPIDLEVIMM